MKRERIPGLQAGEHVNVKELRTYLGGLPQDAPIQLLDQNNDDPDACTYYISPSDIQIVGGEDEEGNDVEIVVIQFDNRFNREE